MVIRPMHFLHFGVFRAVCGRFVDGHHVALWADYSCRQGWPVATAGNPTAGKTTDKEAFIVDCKDQRVPQEVGKPNCIAAIDESGRHEQSFTQIAQKNQVSVGTINVVENFLNNMFIIKGNKNLGVVLNPSNFFRANYK
jgi:hypothetical protein